MSWYSGGPTFIDYALGHGITYGSVIIRKGCVERAHGPRVRHKLFVGIIPFNQACLRKMV